MNRMIQYTQSRRGGVRQWVASYVSADGSRIELGRGTSRETLIRQVACRQLDVSVQAARCAYRGDLFADLCEARLRGGVSEMLAFLDWVAEQGREAHAHRAAEVGVTDLDD